MPWMRGFKEIHGQGPGADAHPEGRPEAPRRGISIMDLLWDGVWPWHWAQEMSFVITLVTIEGWLQGQTHMSTGPELLLIQNASTGLPREV